MDSTNRSANKKVKEKFFTIPYVNSISEKFSPMVNMFTTANQPILFRIRLKISIKKEKDWLDSLYNQNVVYKIPCDNCDATYLCGSNKKAIKNKIT